MGIFAQRVHLRPNLLGMTTCHVLGVEGASIHVRGLDALDGTPVLDIKPCMIDFGPRGDVRQPGWVSSLMSSYCLYIINFYPEAIKSLERFIKQYPADKNIGYAHYLISITYYEQILDEKKDIEPLLKTKKKYNTFYKIFQTQSMHKI